MEEGKITKISIYTRVSTEDQAKEGFSLAAQLDKLRSFCKARDWEIYGEFIDDGYSGRNIKRPEYTKMIASLDKTDGILVMKMDRIHRNSRNFMKMMEALKGQDKEFVSMTESLDTSTAMGRFVMDIVQRIAQLESEQLGERTFIGMKQKAKDTGSGFMGHGVPFGYKLESELLEDGTVKTHLEEHPENIEFAKKIYELAKEGLSIRKIGEQFKETFGLSLGGAVDRVKYVLHNPWYAGWEKWLNELKKNKHKAIVDVKTWNKIQRDISKRVCKPGVRKKPLQLPEDPDATYMQLSKEDYYQTAALRNIGTHKPKHPVNW